MKITALELQSITRYSQTSMAFHAPLNVIVAPNAAGKTTILDAIALGLTGANDRTDKAGKGQENFVAYGKQQGSISLQVSNNGDEPIVVTRFVPGELLIEGQHGNKTQLQDNLCRYLGCDQYALSAALSTTAFIDMKPSEQKSLLFGLLGLSFDPLNLVRLIVDEAMSHPADEVSLTRLLEAAPRDCFTGDASTFEKLYKHFYQLRRDVKRDLKNMGDSQPSLFDEPLPLEESMKKMNELRGLKGSLENKVAEARANVRQRDKLIAEIGELREKLETAGDPEAAVEEYAQVKEAIEEHTAHRNAATTRAGAIRMAHDKFAGVGKKCAVSELVECSMTKPKREKVLAELLETLEGEQEEAAREEERLIPLREKAAELEAELAKPSHTETEAAIEAKEADLAALPSTDADLPKLEAEIDALADRLHEGENKIAEMNQLVGERRAREAQQAKRAQLEQQVEVLEALVNVLSPSGLPGRILSETIGPIQEQANARLRELTGGRYSLEMVLEPDFAIFVEHDGVRTDLKRLSSSERMRVGVVLQSVLVGLTGLRFMIVDNFDLLDPTNRNLVMDALLAISREMDQVIVLSTIGPNGAVNPHIEGVAVYELADGQLREIA